MFGVDDLRTRAAVGAFVKLMRASRAVTARIEPRLLASGLTMTQFGVLEAILHKGPLSHRDLGRKVLSSAGNLTDVIDKLEARGLVRRVRGCTDRRQVRVELTCAGQAMIACLFPCHANDIAQAMAGLDPCDLEVLGRMLRRLGMAAAQPPVPPPLADGDDCATSCISFDIEQ